MSYEKQTRFKKFNLTKGYECIITSADSHNIYFNFVDQRKIVGDKNTSDLMVGEMYHDFYICYRHKNIYHNRQQVNIFLHLLYITII